MSDTIKTRVTDQGLVIPLQLLEGIDEVEIRKENNVIFITPTSQLDPIFGLGKQPVQCGLSDASENHDKYITE